MKNGLDGYGNPIGSPWTPEREKDALSRKFKRMVGFDTLPCDVTDNSGNHCQEEPCALVTMKESGNMVRLCEKCLRGAMERGEVGKPNDNHDLRETKEN